MSTPAAQPISLFDEVKLQAQALVPVLRALRTELGKDKVDGIISQPLRDWVRSVYRRIGEQKPGDARQKWEGVWDELRPRIGDAVKREYIRDDDEAREYNVTRCRFAEFFKALGEPELGEILLCDFDYYIAEVGAPAVEFTRTQTIMKGAAYCDLRYRFKRLERASACTLPRRASRGRAPRRGLHSRRDRRRPTAHGDLLKPKLHAAAPWGKWDNATRSLPNWISAGNGVRKRFSMEAWAGGMFGENQAGALQVGV